MNEIECVGGPYDGRLMPDQGLIWRICGRPEPRKPEAPWQPPPEPITEVARTGTYVKSKGRYRWQED